MSSLNGRYIQAVRVLHGLTLRELATLLGISLAKLSRIENANSTLDDKLAKKFCTKLHVKADRIPHGEQS